MIILLYENIRRVDIKITQNPGHLQNLVKMSYAFNP
jgi:hypothetical protein